MQNLQVTMGCAIANANASRELLTTSSQGFGKKFELILNRHLKLRGKSACNLKMHLKSHTKKCFILILFFLEWPVRIQMSEAKIKGHKVSSVPNVLSQFIFYSE